MDTPKPLTEAQAQTIALAIAKVDEIVATETMASQMRLRFPEHEWRNLIFQAETSKACSSHA